MRVLLINGSPRPKGCTFTALEEVARSLSSEGIGTEMFHIGTEPLSGCTACRSCREAGRCKITDRVNELLDIAGDADGYVFGSPVHYARPAVPLPLSWLASSLPSANPAAGSST